MHRLIVSISLILAFCTSCSREPEIQKSTMAFDGESSDLKSTQIVPTLDTAIEKGVNAIWCASFVSAWKTLEEDLTKEPVSLETAPEIVTFLNKAADPRSHIPKSVLYTATGWKQKGIINKIRKDLKQKFPTKTPPIFSDIAIDSFVAYAYLEVNLQFSLPYFQNREPLVFSSRAGKRTKLSSFGIRPEDDYAYFKLRQQPAILFVKYNNNYKHDEFIVDLDRASKPSQIIIAMVERKHSLAQTYASVEAKITSTGRKAKAEGLGPNDVLFVPDILWHIKHHFSELEGHEFTNTALKGQRLDIALQDIQFRLDRSGAELKSEAKMYMAPIPTYYVFDRPFLLYMKKRGAKQPYFVMWIENAELLQAWNTKKKSQQEDALDGE